MILPFLFPLLLVMSPHLLLTVAVFTWLTVAAGWAVARIASDLDSRAQR